MLGWVPEYSVTETIRFEINNRSVFMFKKISHMFTSFKDGSDYDDDYDEDYEDELEEERLESSRSRQLRRNDYDDEDEDEEPSFFEKKKKTAAPKDNRKVIPIKKSGKGGTEVCVKLPKGFDEVEDICDKLLAGSIVALNLEALDTVEAQRIVDFVFGTMHAINGKFRAVSKYVYIISPENVELSVENEEELIDTLFAVPKLNGQ